MPKTPMDFLGFFLGFGIVVVPFMLVLASI